MHTKLIAIVPAAGIGTRALSAESGRRNGWPTGATQASPRQSSAPPIPKQYWLLKGEPMLRWAVKALLADPRIAQVRVAVAADDVWIDQALAGLPRTVWRHCGGPTRAETVMAALQDAGLEEDDWVLIHDAARPGLPADALSRLIDSCLAMNAGGLLAQRVADTVKRAASEQNAVVQSTVTREGLWLAQTPQMFPAGRLCTALSLAGVSNKDITDEASAMELAGYAPKLIPGSARNFKVTWPEDFDLMEKWL
ncbi:2-C-methyl-D-erythritol 4-phosphate cytidylyltransferase [Candidimonas sp. SYP-B2681]|uniref:IspD/TarI family cytidylyltransferase n=1 Tax=Candidimonas sp. SYP-B2681 TaxID=2497686 RepID=UPI000F86A496|nr:2-C-methyl-D-erythritol 4-phosphate cytidylyltransferase [Candidimonas sp. SYP-B2681]RTZ42446.1 2-C-methyl-D-erythritol 4-phosphate cytidylyltransferase [Candidimonas sp. SYP-B2681]